MGSPYEQLIAAQQVRTAALRQAPITECQARLRRLKAMLLAAQDAVVTALAQDLNKSPVEAYASEIAPVLAEIDYQIKHLRGHARPVRRRVGSLLGPASGQIWRQPYGAVLIISPWNYPISLSLLPLAGALAAGNSCVLKPSEFAPASSRLLAAMIGTAFNREDAAVIEGDENTARGLLDAPWNYIFFTGSPAVGSQVYQAAARHLIPVTLELGGKNPCIILPDSLNLTTARRIVWGKFLNCGQTCVAPDFLLLPEDALKPFTRLLRQAIEQFYGTDPISSPDYGKLVHDRHFHRISRFLKEGDILYGGKSDLQACRIEPTLIGNLQPDSAVLHEEIFGPVLPLLTYKRAEDLDAMLNKREPSLVCYAFGKNKAAIRQIHQAARCACFSVNQVVRSAASPKLPFGGIGSSGFGRYHGTASYNTFTYEKVVYRKAAFPDLQAQYPPYSPAAYRLIRKFAKWLI